MTGRKRKNWAKCVGVLILMVVLVGGGVLIWKNFGAKGESQESGGAGQSVETKPEDENKDESGSEKKEEAKAEEGKVDTGKEEIKQFDGSDPNVGEKLTGVITYAGVNDGSLMVRVNIDQYLASGTCKLELLKDGGIVYGETAEVADSAATATCKGFNVAVAGLPSGKINIKILVASGEKTGIIEGEVTL